MKHRYIVVPKAADFKAQLHNEDSFIKWWAAPSARNCFSIIIAMASESPEYIMHNADDVDEWIYGIVQSPVGRPTPADKPAPDRAIPKNAINPSHYRNYMGHDLQLQWLEAMQYLPHFKDPNAFKAAVELQIRKYLDRCGGKDNELQELKKAGWYLNFLTAYVANGNKPIRVNDIKGLIDATSN